jgi:hypothetical protein
MWVMVAFVCSVVSQKLCHDFLTRKMCVRLETLELSSQMQQKGCREILTLVGVLKRRHVLV